MFCTNLTRNLTYWGKLCPHSAEVPKYLYADKNCRICHAFTPLPIIDLQTHAFLSLDNRSDGLVNGRATKHVPVPQKSLPDLPPPRVVSDSRMEWKDWARSMLYCALQTKKKLKKIHDRPKCAHSDTVQKVCWESSSTTFRRSWRSEHLQSVWRSTHRQMSWLSQFSNHVWWCSCVLRLY